ncbi:MAG: hypothetical protein ABIO84_10455 [Lysobacter sp.]
MKKSVIAAAIVVASSLLAGGCSGESPSAVPEAAHRAAKKEVEAIRYKRVTFDTDAGTFWFQPSVCSVHEEDGSPAYNVGGPGQSPDGQPVFVSMGDEDGDPSTGIDVRIHVGVDVPNRSGDPDWISNDHQSVSSGVPKSQTVIEGKVVSATGVMFGKDYGGELVVDGTIRVDCNL